MRDRDRMSPLLMAAAREPVKFATDPVPAPKSNPVTIRGQDNCARALMADRLKSAGRRFVSENFVLAPKSKLGSCNPMTVTFVEMLGVAGRESALPGRYAKPSMPIAILFGTVASQVRKRIEMPGARQAVTSS